VDPQGVLLQPRYNIAPSQNHPVVIINQDQRELTMMRWGLIPPWAKDISIGYRMINARAETVAEKASFKKPFKDKRCLVLADGFYEWKKTDKKNKIPYYFMLKSKQPFAFAGLWEQWKNPEGEKILSFTIITTKANELMEPIHDRMPVILKENVETQWLDPENKDTDKLLSLLQPYPGGLMLAYRVSPIVNAPKNDTPECIEPITEGSKDESS
jgi:putative SOS response-associated peptidase YedK